MRKTEDNVFRDRDVLAAKMSRETSSLSCRSNQAPKSADITRRRLLLRIRTYRATLHRREVFAISIISIIVARNVCRLARVSINER